MWSPIKFHNSYSSYQNFLFHLLKSQQFFLRSDWVVPAEKNLLFFPATIVSRGEFSLSPGICFFFLVRRILDLAFCPQFVIRFPIDFLFDSSIASLSIVAARRVIFSSSSTVRSWDFRTPYASMARLVDEYFSLCIVFITSPSLTRFFSFLFGSFSH